jgi:hypothetical protein
MRLALCLVLASCASPPASNEPADLPIGDQLPDDKADGNWGAALTCKTLPTDLPTLPQPRIVVSLEGETVHLIDDTVGFDKVFPAGVGALDNELGSNSYGESLSYGPIAATGKNDFQLVTANIQPCKTWWTDPDTGAKSPVFAGLPFMPFFGGYALHGPIDNFRAANGGSLRRGMVSHGCIRMEAADVGEVYARIRGVSSVPVHLQREPERLDDGTRSDVPARWVGAECVSDGDCNFTGGFCKQNAYSGRGFCTMPCTATCADKTGYTGTFCVADPDDATHGICVNKVSPQNPQCRAYDHFVAVTQKRFKQTLSAQVCMPGSPGWVGDRCLVTSDCKYGTTCSDGVCTESCARYCSDEPGWATTFCAADPTLGNTCLRTCTPASNAPECPAGFSCESRNRPGTTTSRTVCVPG